MVVMAQKIREALGEPVRINSGCRCIEHNKKVGGVKDNYHTLGEAADLSTAVGSARLFAVIRKLFAEMAGTPSRRFRRIGRPRSVGWTCNETYGGICSYLEMKKPRS